ncbi:MAG: hypothetical protein ABIR47_10930 [Candidatus Kapaibacterium sp.]
MLTYAVVLFAVAAVLGIALASSFLRGKVPSVVLAVIHGLFAASGLVIVLIGVIRAAHSGIGGYALGLFILAALGGFILFSLHLRKKAVPTELIVGHGLAAVVGFVLLLLWVFGNGG